MTSVQRSFAQRDNRLETITLTGYITDNGGINSVNNVPPQHPAYAEINLTKAQNFFIDTQSFVLRTDPGLGKCYLLRIYMDETKPPLYYQNFEWTVFVRLPTSDLTQLIIQVFKTKSEAESVDNNYIFALSNQTPDGNDIWPNATTAITMQLVNNEFVLKSVSPQLYYG
jgi:hypothetical protein